MDIVKEYAEKVGDLQEFNLTIGKAIQDAINKDIPAWMLYGVLHKEFYNVCRTAEKETRQP